MRPILTSSSTVTFTCPVLDSPWPGVAMKFSMLLRHEKLTIPAHGEGGDWIVKTPDTRFRDVPRNEFTMMSLAGAVGIDVPEIKLVPRDHVDDRLPAGVWPEHEEFAYAIRRFDRDERRGLRPHRRLGAGQGRVSGAQIRGQLRDRRQPYLPRSRYEVAARIHPAAHVLGAHLQRRLSPEELVANLPRRPRSSAVACLRPGVDRALPRCRPPRGPWPEFGGSKDFHRVRLGTFRRLQERLGVRNVDLAETAAATVERTLAEWPRLASLLDAAPRLQESINLSIGMRSKTIMGSLV